MKILIATGLFPPHIGGPATYGKLLVEELPKHNFQVSVLSFGSVRRLPKILRHLAYFFKVLRAGRKADIIFAQDPVSVGLPSALAAKILRKRFILKIVGDYAWEQSVQKFGVKDLLDEFIVKKYNWRVELLRTVQRFTAKSAGRIIVPSQYLKKIVTLWGISGDKIFVIYNAFESLEYHSLIRANKRMTTEDKLIVSAGRLVPWKGFPVLIEVIKDINAKFPEVKLLMIGDGPERGNLESRIRNYGLSDRVKLLGALSKEDLLYQLRASDLFVLNTGYEGFSHQILEAMACGLPVVTTKAGGNPELITDGEHGLLVDFNDKEGLKRAITSILKDQRLSARLAKNAKVKAGEFNLEKMISKTAEILSL